MDFNVVQTPNTFDKIRVESFNLMETLTALKNFPEYDFDRLNTVIAVDLGVEANQIELIYDLYSTNLSNSVRVSVLVDRNSAHVPSVVEIFKSAYFDECEIYDMFGVVFDKNPNLKRLLMPESWVGNPLRKDYVQDDKRLVWND